MMGIKANSVKLSQLRALVAVNTFGNFSEAAMELDLSQSAVSYAIAALEENLGVSLLVRGRQGARLTPVGEAVLKYAVEALQALDKLVEEANLHKGLAGGSVRVAAFHSIAANFLPAVIAQFRARLPDISVVISEYVDSWTIEKALQEGVVDIGFLDEPATAELETWEVLHDEFVALLPAAAKLDTTSISWEQLSSYPFINEAPGNACAARLQRYLQACDVTLPVAYEIQEDATRVRMVAQGLGVAIMPWLAAQPLPEGVRAYRLPVAFERLIQAAVVADRLQSPAVYAFLDTLKTRAAEGSPICP